MSNKLNARGRVHQDEFPSLVGTFAERASQYPDRVAIEASGRAMTNRQLLDWSAYLADSLAKHGVSPSTRVVIIGPRGPAVVAAMLATLSRGGVVVPLDWSTPADRRRLMVRDSEANLIIQIGEGVAIESEGISLLRIPAWPDQELETGTLEVVARSSSDPAYIFFTSGSTGKPKGILGSSGGFTQFMHWMAETFEIGETDRVSLSRNLGFDAVMREIFVPLISGARIVVTPDPMDPDDAIAWLRRQRITITNVTPSHAELWLEGVETSTSSLRWVFFSGEIVTPRLVLDWRARVNPSGDLVNFYGPTETTFIRTFHVIGDVTPGEPIPVGRPLPGTEILVLDEHGQEAPNGEIVIRTDFGTLGYVNVKDDQSFVSNPLTGDPDDIVYRTGDVGTRRDDGTFVVSGRTDFQIKILGVRVEPEEIEAILEEHPGVKRAAVVPVQNGGRITRLDAAIVATSDAPTTASLRDHLRSKVSRVAIPARYVVVDTLPVNANGKIDRAQIATMVGESTNLTPDRPTNPPDRIASLSQAKRALLERRLSEASSRQEPAPQDTASRIAQLSPAKRALLEARSRASSSDSPHVKRAPLSSAQLRLWVLDRMYPGSANYSITKIHRLRGPLDIEILQRACDLMATRHEILRTRYVATDGEPIQVVDAPGPIRFVVIDLGERAGDRQAEAARIGQEEAAHSFDLASEPVWRTTIVRISSEEHILITVVHHIASDGWSLPILFSELSATYNALLAGSNPELDPMPIQYIDYAIRQRQSLDDGTYKPDLAFWRGQLEGVPDSIDLKPDRPRPDIMTFTGRNHRFVLTKTDQARFMALAREESVTPFMLSLAVFVSHLHERSGSDDVVVGIPSADRGSADTQGLIGFLVNTLAIRHTLEPGSTFREVVRSVRSSLLAAYDHREVPFEQVVRTVAPARHADRTPLFQVFFQFGVSAFAADPAFADVGAESIERVAEASKFDYTMYLGNDQTSINGNLVYNTDLFDESTIVRLVEDFDDIGDRLVSNPDAPMHTQSREVLASPNRTMASPRASLTTDEVDPALLARMCEIWREVIGTEVGPDDNFFELGGHSLTAIRAFSRVDTEWDVGLPISTIFEAPTPRSFVRELERYRSGEPAPEQAPPAAQGNERSPLSFAQRRLWFLQMLTPEVGNYHTPWRLRLKGGLSLPALHYAMDRIVTRHPVFRTKIQEENGVPFQVVETPSPHPIELVEVEASMDLAAALRHEAFAPFDLATEYPIRTKVFRIAHDDHILSIVAHHIATDADSMELIRRDLQELYTAHVEGRAAELPNAATTYAEFARHQQQQLTADDPDLNWWLRALEGSTSSLDLPTDRIRPPQPEGEAGVVRFEVDREVSAEVERLARDEGMTSFMTYLAVYALLVHRFTRQNDFVIGIPSTERNNLELENVVGFFVNPVPIRIRIEPGLTIRGLLKHIRSSVLEALAHRHVPFEAVVEHLDAPRDPSRTPIFQTMFDMRSGQSPGVSLPGLSTVPLGVDLGSHPAKYDLRTHVTNRNGGVTFLMEFRNDLFDKDTVLAMAEHYTELLLVTGKDSDRPIESLRAEGPTQVPEPRSIANTRLIDLTDRMFEQVGSAVAVVDGKKSYSYGEVAAASHRIATALGDAGIEAGDAVGVQMPRGADIVAAIVGILRSGAVYVPLDLAYPQARVDTIAQDARLKAILSRGKDIHNPLIEVRTVLGKPDPETSDRIAYIMYTSGSTGSPKGVEIEEQSIVNLVCEPNYVDLSRDSVIGFASNTGFDAATFEMWGALLNGATLYVLDNATLLSPEKLADAIRSSGITVMFLTTALFNAVIRHTPAAFESLDTLLVGGEAVDPDAVRSCLESGPPRRLVNAYGPTETTTFAAWKLVTTVPDRARTVPIGTAISGASVAVVDANLNPLPTGAPGELVVGGLGVAAGYRGNPESTAERFVNLGGQRAYRTGDLVRRRRDGDIEFLGRIDRQIKLRGFRIEPGEIEAHLRNHPGIKQAHVVVRSSGVDSRLVAYVVGQVTPQTALAHLAPLLPGFMIPSAIVVVDALPLTANGKVDEAALPSPAVAPRAFQPPQGSAQIAMARLWEQTLEIEGIGADSNFFDLGGHSLLAIRLMAAIEKQFGERLPLSALFEVPTLAALTDRISAPAPERTSLAVTIRPGAGHNPIVCMPPAGGNVMTYELMSRTLDVGRPIIGIEAVGLDGKSSPLKTIESLADHCRAAMKSEGLTGPYVLVGYSLGGLIAFEVARRLRSEGEAIELVVVIDARARPGGTVGASTERKRSPSPHSEERYLRRMGKGLARRTRRLGGRLRHGPKTVIARLTDRPLSPRLVERLMFRAATKAASTYEPGPYDGRVLYILAGDPADPSKGPAIAAWQAVTGLNLEVVGVAGTHRGEQSLMRAPHAEMVATYIAAALNGTPAQVEDPR
ncbi:MAG: amino acid adenylation domain-containing protein [Acidimicrobiia bacterium]|nr:amino acid adenylation domain-containing protein [Acidimicrobiia bacterium]